MKIFGLSITRNRNSKIANQKSMDPSILAWLRGDDLQSSAPTLSNAYEQVVWVYRAINALAEQLANIPFLFSRGERGREHLITSGPLHDFYNRPHPHLNRFQYWELRVLWLMLRGESFRIPIYTDNLNSNPSSSSSSSSPLPAQTHHLPLGGASLSSSGGEGRGEEAVSSLHHSTTPSLRHPEIHQSTNPPIQRPALRHVLILDPANFQHIIENNSLLGWRYTAPAQSSPIPSQVFLPEEVWHDKLPNPFDFWRGLSPLAVAGLAAKTDFAAASFMRGLLENNGDLGTIIRTTEQLDELQREQVLAELRSRRRRAGSPDRPLLLSDTLEVIRPTLSSADLQFLENRKFSRAEICAAFGVPEEIVATSDHNKYDVMQGARLNFIENRIAPLCARLEADEQRTIQAIDPQAVGWFDLDSLPIMQNARRARLATAKTGFDMGIPVNELNRVLDLGFAPLPWGNTGFLPATLQPVGQSSPPAIVAQASPPASSASVSLAATNPSPLEKLERFLTTLSPSPPGPRPSGDASLLNDLRAALGL